MSAPELEVVWHGGLHREFQQIVPIPVSSAPVTCGRPASERRDQVLGAVDETEWRSIWSIAKRVGLTVDTTTRYLRELHATGQVERRGQIRERRGRKLLYRRIRAEAR